MPGSYKGHAFDVWIFGLRNPSQQCEVLHCALSASGHGIRCGSGQGVLGRQVGEN